MYYIKTDITYVTTLFSNSIEIIISHMVSIEYKILQNGIYLIAWYQIELGYFYLFLGQTDFLKNTPRIVKNNVFHFVDHINTFFCFYYLFI